MQEPKTRLYIYDSQTPGTPDWEGRLLPDYGQGAKSGNNEASTHTFGDYFSALKSFCLIDDCRHLRGAVKQISSRDGNISGIDITAKKHGRLYHPAKIDVFYSDEHFLFAANPAFSSAGQEMIEKEVTALLTIEAKYDSPYTPKVVAAGDGVDCSGSTIPIFLCNWFEGFSEFHYTGDGSRVIVWKEDGEDFLAGTEDVLKIHELTASILTSLYDFETSERVSRWSHAAGDFIAKFEDDGPDIRLITVREYSPMLEAGISSPVEVLEGLLLFLMDLSIKNRTDRLDGTGDYVLAASESINATLAGFFRAFREGMPDDLITAFSHFVSGIGKNRFNQYAESVLGSYDPALSWIDVFMKDAENHKIILYKGLEPFL